MMGLLLLILLPFWSIWALMFFVWWYGYKVPPHPLPRREPYPFR